MIGEQFAIVTLLPGRVRMLVGYLLRGKIFLSPRVNAAG